VLFPRAAAAREVIETGLVAKGWAVEAVDAYRTVPAVPTSAKLQQAASADAIAFTSSSTVSSYIAAAGTASVPPVVACIGAVTARTAEAAGLHVDVIPEASTLRSLVDALARRLGP
jgi:uroporphyrinogen-III synthase